jgi:hypothetical protein
MNVTPPNYPWTELKNPSGDGYLSVYYSDDISPLPVRFVTKPGDNKSDPNLETLTYGLFSTCSPSMRAGIVKRNCSYIFFTTHRKAGRVLTGFYHVRWYSSANSPRKNDFYLAADAGYFVAEAPLLSEVDRKCGTKLNRRFRSTLLLNAKECSSLRKYLESFPNALANYRNEIDRLERFSLIHTGFRYPSWKRKAKFDWVSAEEHLNSPKGHVSTPIVNASPSGQWKCTKCPNLIKNKALLRQCPHCGALGTLMPA